MRLFTLILAALLVTALTLVGCKQEPRSGDTKAEKTVATSAAAREPRHGEPGHEHSADEADHDHEAEAESHEGHDHGPGDSHDHGPGDTHDEAAAGDTEENHEADDGHDHEHEPRSIAVPETVRSNLGITFVRAERRSVASTIRVPGRFELLPNARREYRTMLAGRVEILVDQFQPVESGTPLYRLDSPPWRELQEKLNEADATIRRAQVRTKSLGPLMAAHRDHAASLQESVALWAKRVEQLDQTRGSGVVTADEHTAAQTSLATSRAELAEVREKEAELAAQQEELRFELEAARARMKLLIETASTLLGLDEAELIAPCTPESHENAGVEHHSANGPSPLWREIDRITVRASRAGVVETLALANGAWASETSLVLSIVQPDQVRFRARGMQSDLGRLANGLPARIVPPAGGSLDVQNLMEGELVIGLAADPEERTVELLVTPQRLAAWARAGVSAFLEVLAAGGQPALAVPTSAVVQDGLEHVIFRRDPTNPDSVLRVPAELGVSDGRWVVVKHGVQPGDEIVLDGVYQLMLATTGAAQQGGHFDPDGTFHTGKH